MLQGLNGHRGLGGGPCPQGAEYLYGVGREAGGGGQEKVPRIVRVEVCRRRSPPTPQEFRERSPGQVSRSDLILHSSMETLHLGSFERILAVLGYQKSENELPLLRF